MCQIFGSLSFCWSSMVTEKKKVTYFRRMCDVTIRCPEEVGKVEEMLVEK